MLLFSNLALMFWFTKWTGSCILEVHPCHFPLSGGTLILTGEVHWPLLWPYLSRGLFPLSGFSRPFLAACAPVLQTNAHRDQHMGHEFIAHSWCLICVHCCPPNLSKVMQGWENVRAAKRAEGEVSDVSWVREQPWKSKSSWQLRQLQLRDKMATEFDIT